MPRIQGKLPGPPGKHQRVIRVAYPGIHHACMIEHRYTYNQLSGSSIHCKLDNASLLRPVYEGSGGDLPDPMP